MAQWLTAEVLGESAYDEFVKTNRRQMRGFELVLKESAAELTTEEAVCDFLSTTEATESSSYRYWGMTILSMRWSSKAVRREAL